MHFSGIDWCVVIFNCQIINAAGNTAAMVLVKVVTLFQDLHSDIWHATLCTPMYVVVNTPL